MQELEGRSLEYGGKDVYRSIGYLILVANNQIKTDYYKN